MNTDGYAGRFNNNDKYTFVINNNTWTNFISFLIINNYNYCLFVFL